MAGWRQTSPAAKWRHVAAMFRHYLPHKKLEFHLQIFLLCLTTFISDLDCSRPVRVGWRRLWDNTGLFGEKSCFSCDKNTVVSDCINMCLSHCRWRCCQIQWRALLWFLIQIQIKYTKCLYSNTNTYLNLNTKMLCIFICIWITNHKRAHNCSWYLVCIWKVFANTIKHT